MDMIPELFHVLIHDSVAYRHEHFRNLSLYISIFFSGKNTIDNHLSTMICVNCRLPVTLTSGNTSDIENLISSIRMMF